MQLLLLLLSFTPLVVLDSFLFPAVSGKVIFIRLIVTVVLVMFSIRLFRPEYGQKIYNKVINLFKNKLFISVIIYFCTLIISTIFAKDKLVAFVGELQRGEGFIGMFFFILTFILFLLLFEKRDWLWFFRLSLISGFVLLVQTFSEFSRGILAPSPLIGNRDFFAGFILFVIFSGIIVFREAVKERDKLWFWFSGTITPLSIIAIFMLDKKGAVASLAVGILAAFSYLTLHFFKKRDLEKSKRKRMVLMLTTLIISMLGSGLIFFTTRESSVWQKIPGLRHLATLSIQNQTVRPRLILAGVSLKAINPSRNGIQKFMTGWGLDNYSLAWYKYYDPSFYTYEVAFFDRAHNKLFDVLVMNGILGLSAYLAIWFFFFWQFLKKRDKDSDGIIETAMVFFGVSYFFQNLFLFDQISTYIPFFALLAFSVFNFDANFDAENNKQNYTSKSSGIIWCAITICAVLFFNVWTVLPIFQTKRYLALTANGQSVLGLSDDKFVFNHYGYDDRYIREDFVSKMVKSDIHDDISSKLFDLSVREMEDGLVSSNGRYYPKYLGTLGAAYNKKAVVTGDRKYYLKAEDYFRKALEVSPSLQSLYYDYANNLFLQGRNDEAENLMRKALSLNEDAPAAHFYLGVFLMLQLKKEDYSEAFDNVEFALNSPYLQANWDFYTLLGKVLGYLYEKNDKEKFLKIFEWLSKYLPDQTPAYEMDLYNQTIDYIKKNNTLPDFSTPVYQNEFKL